MIGLGCLALLTGISALETGGAAALPDADLQQLVRRYSKQEIVCLDVGEEQRVRLRGATHTLRLVSVKEERDSVLGLPRKAQVVVELDNSRIALVCAPYVMPTDIRGLRIQADTTRAWADLPKQVQLSLWDVRDPIVDAGRFGFPLREYRLFSHGTQAFNESVHLGRGDGDPKGQRFCHNYGFDMAGFEGGEEVVSATDGAVALFWPSRADVCSVVVQDDGGLLWEYAHLASFAPDIQVGARVRRGQKLGVLGKTGPSGDFSHLHLGSILSRADVDAGRMCVRLNLYPWLVAAYQAARPKSVLAVARPHQTVRVGERVDLDGGSSLAFGTRIVSWQWDLPDGTVVRRQKAATIFQKPGAYSARLRVQAENGAQDIDFCEIRVFSSPQAEPHVPTLFLTCTPTEDIRAGQAVRFKGWFQGDGGGPIRLDFGDGSRLEGCRPREAASHAYAKPGLYVVTASCDGPVGPAATNLKVVVR